MGALLSIQHVSKRLGARQVVNAVDLQIGVGEFVGLVGPNGAGKTTLLKLMAKLIEPSGGAAWLECDALANLSRRAVARRVAVVPQSHVAEFAFPALDVVLMGRHVHRGRFESDSSEDVRIAFDAMVLTDTAGLAERAITELSGGERQRVILARALAQRPRLLLMDEPTANLDLRHEVEVLERVRALARAGGIAVVAALHDLELASRFCGRLILMSDGTIVADGSPREILTPARLRDVFGVAANVSPNPLTGGLTITVLNGVTDGV